MPPDHGAALVCEILSTPELDALWRSELDGIREHVRSMRTKFRKTLEDANPGFDASFIESQQGMFSCLPVTDDEQMLMEDQFHLYMLPHARVNVAAMNEHQSRVLADAFAFIRQERAGKTRRANA
jgi:aspartate/tyrosine/aromatic aminotransferase